MPNKLKKELKKIQITDIVGYVIGSITTAGLLYISGFFMAAGINFWSYIFMFFAFVQIMAIFGDVKLNKSRYETRVLLNLYNEMSEDIDSLKKMQTALLKNIIAKDVAVVKLEKK